MGGIVLVACGLWIIVVHGIFAVFLDRPGVDPLAMLLTGPGAMMLVVGSAVGGLHGLCLRRDHGHQPAGARPPRRGFVTAIIVSLGLLVVPPVLGHATWHLYRGTAE